MCGRLLFSASGGREQAADINRVDESERRQVLKKEIMQFDFGGNAVTTIVG